MAADPYRETAQRALMETLAAMGDPGAATFAYREFRQLLLREMHCQPSPETQAAYNDLRNHAAGETPPPSALNRRYFAPPEPSPRCPPGAPGAIPSRSICKYRSQSVLRRRLLDAILHVLNALAG